MANSLGLAISFAGAIVLLLGVLFKRDEHLRAELQVYASGFNRELTRALLEERHDYRIGALLLALGFLTQLLAVAIADPVSSLAGTVTVASVALAVSLALWRIPRRFIVDRQLARLSARVTRDWK